MIITDDDRKAIRAQKEIDVLKILDHPNIARFIDSAVDGISSISFWSIAAAAI